MYFRFLPQNLLKGVSFMEKKETEALDSYRQERKDRIAKQSKDSSKKSNSHSGAKAFFGKFFKAVVSIVVVLAILGGALYYFGVPQRVLKPVTIDGKSYSAAELTCYYMFMYNQYVSMSNSYDSQYGEGYGKMFTGYDTTLSPAEQTTKDHDGNEITWDEYFLEEAIESMANIKRYYDKAVEEGIELSEEDQQEIQDTLDKVQATIDRFQDNRKNYSLSGYLTQVYGKGVDAKLFEKIITEQKMVEVYQEARQDEIKAGYSDDDIAAVYNEDKTAYDVVNFRWFTIDVEETAETESESATGEEESSSAAEKEPIAEELEAKAFIDKIAEVPNYNENTFKSAVLEKVGEDSEDYETYQQDGATLLQKVSKETVETNISEEAATWLYAQDDNGNYTRQAGDMQYFLNEDGDVVYILYAVGTPYRDETLKTSVRHILVKFPEASTEDTSEESSETAEETTVSAEVKSECESEASSILDDYKNYIEENESGKADEEYFGELASKLSDDTGSQSSGGLIEDMNNDGSYVNAFEDWAFAEGEFEGQDRQPGTTGIIETEYGYHIMYYVGHHDNATWYETIQDSLVSEDWEEEQTKFDESFGEDAIVRKASLEAWVKNSCLKKIEQQLSYS